MRWGVFGGSFDPIHLGHLLLAETAWEELHLDRILFIPAHRSPWKEGTSALSEQRWEMLNLAVAGRSGFETSRLELDRQPPSYTVDTLRVLVREFPGDEFWLILGADGIREFADWRSSDEILTLARLAVGHRPGHIPSLPLELTKYEERIMFLSGPCCQLSSTEIRERVNKGQSVRYRVPLDVERYIMEKGLYR